MPEERMDHPVANHLILLEILHNVDIEILEAD